MQKMKSSLIRGAKQLKGQGASLSDSALSFVVLVIIVALGAIILAGFQATTTANSIAFNVTGQGLTGLTTFGNFFGLLATVLVLVAILIIVLFSIRRIGTGGSGI